MIKLLNLSEEINQESIGSEFAKKLNKVDEPGNKKYFQDQFDKAETYIDKLKVYNKLKNYFSK